MQLRNLNMLPHLATDLLRLFIFQIPMVNYYSFFFLIYWLFVFFLNTHRPPSYENIYFLRFIPRYLTLQTFSPHLSPSLLDHLLLPKALDTEVPLFSICTYSVAAPTNSHRWTDAPQVYISISHFSPKL